MNKSKKMLEKIYRLFSKKSLAIIAVLLFIISMIPVVFCTFFDYATGDDLLYGSVIKQAMRDNLPFFKIIKCVISSIKDEYYTFQGAWSVGFLNRMQPGIWGEKLYVLTPWIAIASICVGTGYLFYTLMVRILKLEKSVFWIQFSIINFVMIQYMPFPRGGVFWYTGMINYTFSFGLALVTITWALRYVETGFKRFIIGMVLSMVYLGGAGLPTIVLIAFVFFVFACRGFEIKIKDIRKRCLLLFLPLAFEMVSFIPNAISPGNKVRGGDNFGFSITNVGTTLLKSILTGGTDIIHEFRTKPILYIVILIMLVILLDKKDENEKIDFKHPIMASLFLFITSCTVYAPEMYAGEHVVAGISGGVFDTYFFTFVVCLALWLIYISECIKNICRKRNKDNKQTHYIETNASMFIVVIASLFFVFMFRGRLFDNSLDKTCVHFIASGQLADFDGQMKERLEILQNPAIKDVVLPEMNDQQGPFMHMALTRKPNAYTNYVTAKFYGKDSVVAIPREEYMKLTRRKFRGENEKNSDNRCIISARTFN